jgi:hypothetical protein
LLQSRQMVDTAAATCRFSILTASPLTASLRGLLAVILFLAWGCSAAPINYSLRSAWVHKDVLLVAVQLERRLEVGEYLAIVDEELARLDLGARELEIPVYEVRFEFSLPRPGSTFQERLAQVSVYPQLVAEGGGAASPSVVIY